MMQQRPGLAYPPGGILIWIVLSIELLTFIPGLLVFAAARATALAEFQAAAAQLSVASGAANTLILLTSGWCMANAITALQQGVASAERVAGRWIFFSAIGGLAFLIVKGVEFAGKLDAGLTVHSHPFYVFYWLITGFHYVHVLAGLGLLLYAWWALQARRYSVADFEDLVAIGVFWHMCDLIWILVFPSFYLLR